MSYSDLDPQNFYSDDPVEFEPGTPKKKFSSLLALALFAVAGTFFVQNTLAANIALNTGAPVEFGQGITQTVACSGATNLTITPSSTFTNAAGAGTYKFSSITVSNIPAGCHGSDFTINAYDNSSNTPLALFNTTSTSAVVYNNAGTFELGAGTLSGASITSGSGTFTATFTSPVALSSSIFKITIQSGAHTIICAQGGPCVVGDTGPGGGKIFYVAATPFACGPTRATTCTYLEAAPALWNAGLAEPTRRWAQSTPVNYQSAAVSSPDTATAAAIGWGYRNTRAIVSQGNTNTATSAAALADSYIVTVSGVIYDDWFLPSMDELNQMCKWVRGITGINLTTLTTVCAGGTLNTGVGAAGAGFAGVDYWSSSERLTYTAWGQSFFDGAQIDYNKIVSFHVRPVRAF